MRNSTWDGFGCLCSSFLERIEVRSVSSEHAVLQVSQQKKNSKDSSPENREARRNKCPGRSHVFRIFCWANFKASLWRCGAAPFCINRCSSICFSFWALVKNFSSTLMYFLWSTVPAKKKRPITLVEQITWCSSRFPFGCCLIFAGPRKCRFWTFDTNWKLKLY